MKFIKTAIPEIVICEPTLIGDERGYFFESFRKDKLEDFLGFPVNFCQDNESKSVYGVLRGLHYQLPPHAQSKLVRVVEGKILDVAVDIRKNAPTYAHHVAVELSAENKKQLFIPRGFAHGFVVLSEEAKIAYKCDNYYKREHDTGIMYNDSELNIDWQLPSDVLILSEKDRNLASFSEAKKMDFKQNLY